MPGSSAARKTFSDLISTQEERKSLVKKLDAKDRDPFEYVDLENPNNAWVSKVGKSQMMQYETPVATDQLTIYTELKRIHSFPSKEEEAPLPPKKFPEPPDDAPEDFVMLENVPKYHDLQSYSRREVVFDNSIGEYVMIRVTNVQKPVPPEEIGEIKIGLNEEAED
eukprot:Platyproteum_vivax@DN7477_c2_g1_i2.p2